MDNIEETFQQLVASLTNDFPISEHLPNPERALSLADMNNAIMKLSETIMYLSEFISISLTEEEPLSIPQDVVVQLPRLVEMAIDVSEALHDVTCDCDHDDEDD